VDQAGGVRNLRPDQIAAIVTATTLLGGLAANAAGQSGVAGANAATSEAINNATNPEDIAHGKDLIPLGGDIGTGLGGLGGGGGCKPVKSQELQKKQSQMRLALWKRVLSTPLKGRLPLLNNSLQESETALATRQAQLFPRITRQEEPPR
jgi:hypothetical protein